ncbi:carboxyl-terminal proteinase [Stylonychia lemnae]|uniref:Ubiquitin carboxyl-terminal hydrolase n=1 Tax=Stylonychia lemnae TaxID=5949 RepID=A0A078B2G1_STYLE|nr:carboxyl-terminal proteinase [Stylonychia lemnae]|eukprot:CDW88421.1 carboxyl-terminal proteinase [Stylonychia lemnae]
MEKRVKEWIPLEGNPQVFTDYAEKLGWPAELYKIHDVYGLDDDLWDAMVPQPVLAVILLYQIKKEHRDLIENDISKHKLQTDSPFFIKQTIKNACGTIALLHALLNNTTAIGGVFREESFLEEFYFLNDKTSPEERAAALYKDEKLEETHQEAAVQGETRPQENAECHFVTYIQKDGFIYEMDGRLNAPVQKAEIKEDQSLGKEVSKIIKQYIEISGYQETKFSVMALAPNYGDIDLI